MFFKVNITGCGEYKGLGLVEVRYDLYADVGEGKAYDEYYIQVPVKPKEGYPGKVDGDGNPLDQTDFDKWIASLPTVYRHAPFCGHFVLFEPTVTDAEIEFVGKLALDMAFKNYDNLSLMKNEPVRFSPSPTKIAECEARVAIIKATEWTAVSLGKAK